MLDRIDRDILAALQVDGTLSIAALAERVGLSSTPCWKRLKRLEDDGVIERRVALLDARRRALTWPLGGRRAHIPLQVHATYSLDEVLAAFDERTSKGGVLRIQAGVHRVGAAGVDLLFVTLEKSERDYSPTTLYKDYPLSPTRFHWESQSNAHAGTAAGRRYVAATRGEDCDVLMFVRARKKDARGETMPYTALGRCYYELHRGERPMEIEWTLEHAMPAGLYQETKVAAG